MTIQHVGGYFTTENNIRGLSTQELEARLGFRAGRMDAGVRIWALLREPGPGEYASHGSTRLPCGDGLDHQRVGATQQRPGAWCNRRLVKVEPVTPHTDAENYPPALGMPAEQWHLRGGVRVPARLLGVLARGEAWWGGRGR